MASHKVLQPFSVNHIRLQKLQDARMIFRSARSKSNDN